MYRKTKTGVIFDVNCEQDAIDFALKLKSQEGKSTELCTTHAYFLPNYSKTESAFLINGHHSYQDGISGMCTFFSFSDNALSGNYEHPFIKRKEITYIWKSS